MQRIFIGILNPIYDKITSRIDPAIRMRIVDIALFAIIAFFYACYCSPKLFSLSLDYSTRGFICIVPLAIAILFSIDAPLKKVVWNKGIYVYWMAFGIVLLFWEIVLDMGYGFIPFIFSILVLFPCLYFVWGNRGDYEKLFMAISKAVVIAFCVFYIICVVLFPMGIENMYGAAVRYTGAVMNPNTMGTISATAVTASLYLTACKKDKYLVYMVVCAIAFSLCFYAASRTSMIAIIFQLLVFAIFMLNKKHTKTERNVLGKKFVVLVLIIAIVTPMSRPILELDPIDKIAARQTVYAEDNLVKENLQEENNVSAIKERIKLEGKDLNAISSGRVQIWQVYIDNINFRGHDVKEKYLIAETNGLWAHNIFLELAYRGGILAGILYFIIVAYTAIHVFRLLITKREYRQHMMFTALAVITFFIISMLETPIFPLERDYIFMYFIGIGPMFCKKLVKV